MNFERPYSSRSNNSGTAISIYCDICREASAVRSNSLTAPSVPVRPWCRTKAQKQWLSWSHSVSFGQAYRRIAAPGHGLLRPVSAPKSPTTQLLLLDIVGPLPTSAGYTYYLIAVDRFKHWPEVIPIPNITAETVARALLPGWISRFGCPQQGCQFESQLFHSLAKFCGIHLSRTTAHHPVSLSHNSSTPWLSSLAFTFPGQLLITPQPADSWNAFTGP
jgi:hypothetical protein